MTNLWFLYNWVVYIFSIFQQIRLFTPFRCHNCRSRLPSERATSSQFSGHSVTNNNQVFLCKDSIAVYEFIRWYIRRLVSFAGLRLGGLCTNIDRIFEPWWAVERIGPLKSKVSNNSAIVLHLITVGNIANSNSPWDIHDLYAWWFIVFRPGDSVFWIVSTQFFFHHLWCRTGQRGKEYEKKNS